MSFIASLSCRSRRASSAADRGPATSSTLPRRRCQTALRCEVPTMTASTPSLRAAPAIEAPGVVGHAPDRDRGQARLLEVVDRRLQDLARLPRRAALRREEQARDLVDVDHVDRRRRPRRARAPAPPGTGAGSAARTATSVVDGYIAGMSIASSRVTISTAVSSSAAARSAASASVNAGCGGRRSSPARPRTRARSRPASPSRRTSWPGVFVHQVDPPRDDDQRRREQADPERRGRAAFSCTRMRRGRPRSA